MGFQLKYFDTSEMVALLAGCFKWAFKALSMSLLALFREFFKLYIFGLMPIIVCLQVSGKSV